VQSAAPTTWGPVAYFGIIVLVSRTTDGAGKGPEVVLPRNHSQRGQRHFEIQLAVVIVINVTYRNVSVFKPNVTQHIAIIATYRNVSVCHISQTIAKYLNLLSLTSTLRYRLICGNTTVVYIATYRNIT
jgi:hypothetical protein